MDERAAVREQHMWQLGVPRYSGAKAPDCIKVRAAHLLKHLLACPIANVVHFVLAAPQLRASDDSHGCLGWGAVPSL